MRDHLGRETLISVRSFTGWYKLILVFARAACEAPK